MTGMKDRRWLDVRLVVQGVANDLPAAVTPVKGMQYIVGDSPTGAFANGHANDIAVFTGTTWTFYAPDVLQLEVLDIAENAFKHWNGTEWAVVKTLGGGGGIKIENRTLTADEVTAKAFELAEIVKTGEENNVVMMIEGVTQYAGEAFSVATANDKTTVTWTSSIQLLEGDHVSFVYLV